MSHSMTGLFLFPLGATCWFSFEDRSSQHHEIWWNATGGLLGSLHARRCSNPLSSSSVPFFDRGRPAYRHPNETVSKSNWQPRPALDVLRSAAGRSSCPTVQRTSQIEHSVMSQRAADRPPSATRLLFPVVEGTGHNRLWIRRRRVGSRISAVKCNARPYPALR